MSPLMLSLASARSRDGSPAMMKWFQAKVVDAVVVHAELGFLLGAITCTLQLSGTDTVSAVEMATLLKPSSAPVCAMVEAQLLSVVASPAVPNAPRGDSRLLACF